MNDAVEGPGTPPAAVAARWRLRNVELPLQRAEVMAICNVTPDSFSDGGVHDSVGRAMDFAERAWSFGAALLDIGGESTRPGAMAVPQTIELARVMPVITAVRVRIPQLPLSIDTVKSGVAREALDAGVHVVNDVSGGRLDPAMFDTVAARDAAIVIMHSRGAGVAELASHDRTDYGSDVTGSICEELSRQVDAAISAGISADSIALDPGLGFSKTVAQSITVLRELRRVVALGFPVLVGASRKRFIGELTGVTEPDRRVIGSAVAHAFAVDRGARIIRTHDVVATCESLAVAAALSTRD